VRKMWILWLFAVLSGCVQDSAVKPLKPRLEPLPPVTFRGKPFFPVGAYDTYKIGEEGDLASIDPNFIAAGGNFADLGMIGVPSAPNYRTHSQPAIFAALEKMKDNPDYEKIAFIVGLGFPLLLDAGDAGGRMRHGGMFKPLSGKLLEAHRGILADAVLELRKHPNIIGYTMDEPENLIWPYYKKYFSDDWERNRDSGLAAKMVEWTNWTRPVIREYHPEAKFFPILGWWTTYEAAAPMYDVLIANQYPARAQGTPEFSAPLYEVSYDAAAAVAAARKNGDGRTVIYMPPMFDIINGNYGIRTFREQRYLNFAPITRGVMGIHGWRLQRCSEEHRDTVIYPAMKEVSGLSAFFLGEWLDEYVTSDHDFATVDYLKKFRERIRLVEGEEDGQVREVRDAVPDVSYCLRRHPDGRYLLLAVNNRREPLEVVFTIAVPGRLEEARDVLNERTLNWQGRRLSDRFLPFGVHAYIFDAG